MKTTQWMEVSRGFDGGTQIIIVETEVPDVVGRLAIEFAERFALVAGIPDGEDSAGRSKLRLGTPEEVVTRACDLAEETWKQLRARGHTLTIPVPKPGKSYEDIEREREAARELRQTAKAERAALAQP